MTKVKKLFYSAAALAMLMFVILFIYSKQNPGDFPFGEYFGPAIVLPIVLITIAIAIIENLKKSRRK